MKMRINLFGYSFYLTSIILLFAVFITLICLGNWQLYRLKEKRAFIKYTEASVLDEPIVIGTNNASLKLYTKIQLVGTFVPDNDILLYGRRSSSPEKDGYYLLSAFKAHNGQIYLVSRGWFAQSAKKSFLVPNNGQETIEAIVLPGEKKQFMVPKNDNNLWFTIDLDMARSNLGVNETRYYLMQIHPKNLPKEFTPHRISKLTQIRNDHLEYALTWYSLAIGVIIMFVINCKRKN
jgi:surfeit locus 1 family protein